MHIKTFYNVLEYIYILIFIDMNITQIKNYNQSWHTKNISLSLLRWILKTFFSWINWSSFRYSIVYHYIE